MVHNIVLSMVDTLTSDLGPNVPNHVVVEVNSEPEAVQTPNHSMAEKVVLYSVHRLNEENAKHKLAPNTPNSVHGLSAAKRALVVCRNDPDLALHLAGMQ